jgi:hypothetical protein
MLIESLNLPGSVYVLHLLRNRTIRRILRIAFKNCYIGCRWSINRGDKHYIFSCRNAQWLNLDASPKFEFISKKIHVAGKMNLEPFEFCKRQTEYRLHRALGCRVTLG